MSHRAYLYATNRKNQDGRIKGPTLEIAESRMFVPLLWVGMFRVVDMPTSAERTTWANVAPTASVKQSQEQLRKALPRLARLVKSPKALEAYADRLCEVIDATGRKYVTLDCWDLDSGTFCADFAKALASLEPKKRLATAALRGICAIDAPLSLPTIDEFLAQTLNNRQIDGVMRVMGYGEGWQPKAKRSRSSKKSLSPPKLPASWTSTVRSRDAVHELVIGDAQWKKVIPKLSQWWANALDYLDQVEQLGSFIYLVYEEATNSCLMRTGNREPSSLSYDLRGASKHIFRATMTVLEDEARQVPDKKQSEHNNWVGIGRISKRLVWALRSAAADEPAKSKLKQLKKKANITAFYGMRRGRDSVVYPEPLSLTRPRAKPNMIGSTSAEL